MKKAITLPLLITVSCLIAGVYGIFHDQITFTISPEYYTKYKFIQFGLTEFGMPERKNRVMAAIVGWMATWWVGLILGIILSLTGLIHKTWQQMFKVTLKAILINLLVSFVFGILGYLYALAFMPHEWEDYLSFWDVPYEIVDITNYLRVGCIHNFGYLGGVIGLPIAIAFSIKSKRRIARSTII